MYNMRNVSIPKICLYECMKLCDYWLSSFTFCYDVLYVLCQCALGIYESEISYLYMYVCVYVCVRTYAEPFFINLQINVVLTGTLSGYFLLIFSPSAFLFSNGCSSLYWNFMLLSAYTIYWLQLTRLALVICTYIQHAIPWRLRWNNGLSDAFSHSTGI